MSCLPPWESSTKGWSFFKCIKTVYEADDSSLAAAVQLLYTIQFSYMCLHFNLRTQAFITCSVAICLQMQILGAETLVQPFPHNKLCGPQVNKRKLKMAGFLC